MMTTEEKRDLFRAAMNYTQTLKPKDRDRAIFDFLAGASAATEGADACPVWLYVIGCRGGNRVKELERLIAEH